MAQIAYNNYDDRIWMRRQQAQRKALRKAADCDVTTRWLTEFRENTLSCKYCEHVFTREDGCTAPHGKTFDHITPVSKGGRHTKANIQVICWLCNNLKSSLTEEEFLKRYTSRIKSKNYGKKKVKN